MLNRNRARQRQHRAELKQAERRHAKLESMSKRRLADAELRRRQQETDNDIQDRVAEIFPRPKAQRQYHGRLIALLTILSERAPDLLPLVDNGTLRMIVKASWIRRPAEWKPKGKGKWTRLRSLIAHLLLEYPVPLFLYELVIPRDVRLRASLVCDELFTWLGAGGSLHDVVDGGLIKVPMTRRMRHLFLTSPAHLGIDQAVRRAQVVAAGQTTAFALRLQDAMDAERVDGVGRGWSDAIAWLCRQPEPNSADLKLLVKCLDERIAGGVYFPAHEGTVRSTLRRARELRELENSPDLPPPQVFPGSGLLPARWKQDEGHCIDDPSHGSWSMVEVRTSRDLIEEGRSMRHCVAEYWEDIAHGEISIWSLKRNRRRRATVQVINKNRHVSAARGRANSNLKPLEARFIRDWGRRNNLDCDWLRRFIEPG